MAHLHAALTGVSLHFLLRDHLPSLRWLGWIIHFGSLLWRWDWWFLYSWWGVFWMISHLFGLLIAELVALSERTPVGRNIGGRYLDNGLWISELEHWSLLHTIPFINLLSLSPHLYLPFLPGWKNKWLLSLWLNFRSHISWLILMGLLDRSVYRVYFTFGCLDPTQSPHFI